MIKGFRERLKNDGRSLLWFHKQYLLKSGRGYISFAQQVGGFSILQEDVEKAIKKYLEDK